MALRKISCIIFAGLVMLAASTPSSRADQIRDRQWWVAGMGIQKAREISNGDGVKVCIIDSGIDAKHPDLAEAKFIDGKDLSGGGRPDGLKPYGDHRGDHGTGMAVNVAGSGHGPGLADGLVGAAPKSSIISVSWGQEDGGDSPIVRGIRYCADAGAKVINLSVTAGSAKIGAAVAYAQSKDVVLVAAAGNDGEEIAANWSGMFGVIQVGGVDSNFQRDSSSSWGGPRKKLGGKITSMGIGVCGPFAESSNPRVKIPQATINGAYKESMGTSVAASVVAGAVATVRGKFPELDAPNVINRIIETAKTTGTKGTPNADCGWGVVDVYAALTAIVPKVNNNPLGQMSEGCYSADRGIFNVKSMGLWDPSYKPDAQSPARPSGSPAMSAEPAGGAPVGLIVGVVGVGSALVGGVYWWLRRRRA
ncbi:S8 family serine peptidase [Austwickia sp. TVS 96-490-7B]|uniref:S8 family serine peptidase n=1 Tax=Austwickia sp. TVS 96-490-7B TaxID=2830843 RepID=UPI001C594588|nr:S8 family serine peptidase [Austwickia sp. TVS 96-490-7B]